MEVETTEQPTDAEMLLRTAKERFKHAQEAENKQRTREKDDLRFQVPEEQWDEDARRQRLGQAVDGVPTPARPILSIPKLDQPIQLVLNQERAAKLGVSIQPLSPDAGVEDAIILEGLYRRIERDSQAHVARSWAFDRAVKCGRGAYRVRTEFDESSDNPSDQVIRIERILHQEAVYFDPSATKPDFSDGEWAFIATWMPLATFKREFPNAQEDFSDEAFADLVNAAPEWVRGDGEKAAVLVAEYFFKQHSYQDVTVGNGQTRKKDVVTVKWAKINGFEVLEEGELDGKWIPLIPVIGKELQPFDSERRWTGIIGPAKDAQRLYNYAASQAVELAALEPKAPYVGAEGQFDGHESEWQQANIRNFPYLEYKQVDVQGKPAPPPQRVQVDMGRLGPSMQLLQQADQFIQITSATFDPSLGRESAREKSGKAIMALQQQGDSANSHYMHNLADISMNYEARVVLDLIPKIYDRPGRLARTLDEEGESETIMLNQPFYTDPETKQPIPVEEGQQPPAPMEPQGQSGMPPPAPPKVKHYDLSKGIYSVAISIGKQRQTALQESAEEIGQILQAQPNLMPLLGPIYFENRDFPGARQIAKVLKQVRDKQFPDLDGDAEGQPSPEQLKAQIGQMGQQMEMMGAQLEAAIKAIETDQAKQQATLLKAQMDNETKLRIAQGDNETKLALAEISSRLDEFLEALKVRHQADENEADRELDASKVLAAPALAVPEFKGSNDMPLENPPGGKEI